MVLSRSDDGAAVLLVLWSGGVTLALVGGFATVSEGDARNEKPVDGAAGASIVSFVSGAGLWRNPNEDVGAGVSATVAGAGEERNENPLVVVPSADSAAGVVAVVDTVVAVDSVVEGAADRNPNADPEEGTPLSSAGTLLLVGAVVSVWRKEKDDDGAGGALLSSLDLTSSPPNILLVF